jgi:hypothetical protein
MLNPLAGAFASRNPRSVLLAGGGFFRAAGPDGLVMARFAFADVETGLAANYRSLPRELVAFVQPVAGRWRLNMRDLRVIRPGYEVTLFARGDFYVQFPAGASRGQIVYASVLDGTPISGEAADAEPTPWEVASDCNPGELAIISPRSMFP